jgi:DNA polymerase-3 subunit delta
VQLRADQLDSQLAKNLAPLYVIHGDEPLLALEAADTIRAAARRQGCGEREVFTAERGFDWSELAQAGASQSLFGDRKIVELRIPTGKPGTQGSAAIAEYCERLGKDNVTLVSLPRLRKDEQGSRWFGALAAAGVVVEIYPIERARLPEWIGARLARQRQRAPAEVLAFLADRVEGNLLAAHQEVQKLGLLLPEGELAAEQVTAAVTNVARYDAYDCAAALLAGDAARYLRVLDGLRGEGESPVFVVWALGEELRSLARIQQGLASGRQIEQLFRENRVWGERQGPMRVAAKRLGPASLERALAHAARIDRAAKGVGAGEPWDEFITLGLELLHGTEAGAARRNAGRAH